ncbi:MAG: hypothetical protein H7839_18995 [Magnetococcus sp. YQC-5]
MAVGSPETLRTKATMALIFWLYRILSESTGTTIARPARYAETGPESGMDSSQTRIALR